MTSSSVMLTTDSLGSAVVEAGFVTTIVYRSVSPAMTNPPLTSTTDLATESVAGRSSVSVSVAVLLTGLGSLERSLVETVTVFVSEPVAPASVWATTV